MKRITLILTALLLCSLSLSAQKFAVPKGGYNDGRRVLLVGNSFTYFNDCDTLLIRIARSQGDDIRLGEYLKGGQTFGQHINLPGTSEAIAAGGYSVAFIQDYSNNHALYSRDGRKDVLANTKLLKERILQASPFCRIILERTWSYYGNHFAGFASLEDFDSHLEKGAKAIGKKTHLEVSPIGNAFNLCRTRHPEIDLLGPDRYHPSLEGSYLKVCVNYLVLTGKPFQGTVDPCGVAPGVAFFLQKVAHDTVFGETIPFNVVRVPGL